MKGTSKSLGVCAVLALVVGNTGCATMLAGMGPGLGGMGADASAAPAARGGAKGKKAKKVVGAKDLGAGQMEASADSLAEEAEGFRNAGNEMGFRNAEAKLKEALKLEPSSTYVLAELAHTYLLWGQMILAPHWTPDGKLNAPPKVRADGDKFFKRAINASAKALKVNSKYGTAHFISGEAYAFMGNYAQALTTFQQIESEKLTPEGMASALYSWMGYCQKMNGDEGGAKTSWDKAVELQEPFEFGEYADLALNPPAAP